MSESVWKCLEKYFHNLQSIALKHSGSLGNIEGE